MASDVHDAAADRLRSDGQRYTRNRRELVAALADAAGPLTIPQLLAQRGQLAQSSAYRNLAVLERAGVVHRIVTNDFARYELAEDLTDHHHHHLICAHCGAVDDFTVPPQAEKTLTRALSRAAGRAKFRTHHHRLDLIGVCHRCR
ncbi:MAG: Fur family transcriptional regulator [Acidimicrobiales bacterium]